MRRPSGRTLVTSGGVVLAIVLFAFLAPRTGDNTLAARRFLEAMGLEVRAAGAPPAPPATFVLLADARDPGQMQGLLSWAGSGGRLVVADPSSTALVGAGVDVRGDAGFVGPVILPASCITRPTLGVDEIVIDARDAMLVSRLPDATACFLRGGGSYALVRRVGDGEVVLLGGSSFMTNDFLDRADNAAFLLGVVGGDPIVFGPALPPGSAPPSLWELLPDPARGIVVGIVVAAAAFALARARRLGRPAVQSLPAPIPASELVRATAGLYRRAHATGFSAQLLRSSARARLARDVGLPPGVDEERLSRAVADAARVPQERVSRALADIAPEGDDELIALGRELRAIVRATEGAER